MGTCFLLSSKSTVSVVSPYEFGGIYSKEIYLLMVEIIKQGRGQDGYWGGGSGVPKTFQLQDQLQHFSKP